MRFAVSEEGVQIGSLYTDLKQATRDCHNRAMDGHPSEISVVRDGSVTMAFTFKIVEEGHVILVHDWLNDVWYRKNRVVH